MVPMRKPEQVNDFKPLKQLRVKHCASSFESMHAATGLQEIPALELSSPPIHAGASDACYVPLPVDCA